MKTAAVSIAMQIAAARTKIMGAVEIHLAATADVIAVATTAIANAIGWAVT